MSKICRSFVIITAIFALICIFSFSAYATQPGSNIDTADSLTANTATPILADGVYRITSYNRYNHRLTVPQSKISDCSTVTAELNSKSTSEMDRYDMNSLWWISHISGNNYSIRPLHKIDKALDVADDGESLQLYHTLSATDTLYSSRWTISQPDEWAETSYYMFASVGNSGKVIYCNAVGNIGICDYEMMTSIAWIMEPLSSAQVSAMEGITFYGDFALKVGESRTFEKNVFSSNSLSQSVTYSIPSGYFGLSVSSGGTITGTSEALTKVKAVSNVDSTISGTADVVVSNTGKVTATLIGIPSSLGGTHDHSSYMTDTETYLKSIYGSVSSVVKKYSVADEYDAYADMINSKVFIFRGHGLKDSIYFGDDAMYSPILYSFVMEGTKSYEFSETELILYMCCLTGEGGADDDNLVRATKYNGAQNIIGFNISIDCAKANLWIASFMEELNKYSSGEITYSDVSLALSYMSYTDISPCITKDNVVFTYNKNTFS